MSDQELVNSITEEVCDLFPEQTAKYRGMIRQCVEQIVSALPPGMSAAQYRQVVREHIQLVRDGQI
jgi:hypothetical protein